jgi:hypothetical protein
MFPSQKHYAGMEALALAHDVVEWEGDTLQPDTDSMLKKAKV